jgi:hypothetical protein
MESKVWRFHIEGLRRRRQQSEGRTCGDRRTRLVGLRVAARYIKMGIVKFPRHGCEQLLGQLLGFGVEKHDDAGDALLISS